MNSKILFRPAIVTLLSSCEFNPKVSSVSIHVCSRIAIPHDRKGGGIFFVKWRQSDVCFPAFRRKEWFAGNAVKQKISFKDKTDLFSTES